MSDLKPEESQQELFVEFAPGQAKKPERFPAFHRAPKPILLTTSVEQILLVGILVILAGCLIFFLGVLRGRSLGRALPERPPVAPVIAPQQKPAIAAPLAGKPQAPRQMSVFQASPSPSPAVKIETRPAQAPDPTKPYTLQLITYRKKDLAENEVEDLRRRGFQAFTAQKGDYYLVCSGQYGSKEEADRDLKALRARYKDCFLKRR
ncbi:MAG: SPOR domain-containing protein [Candidatus Omnitrophota bacterium]